jgi:hypothetical protein
MFTPSIPACLTKPYDIALTYITQAEEFAREVHKTGDDSPPAFLVGGIVFSIHTTPSGQLRYTVGLQGKAERSPGRMLAALIATLAEKAEADDRNARTVPCVADTLYIPGHEVSVTLKGTRLLKLNGTYNYFHVGAIPRGQSARKVHGGPLVEGPWAFTHGKATCLTANRAIAERDAAERDAALVVEDGSLILVDGVEYRVGVVRGEWLRLDAVDTSNETL